nr:hypothetical protein NG677_12110 [Methylobacterium sp. OTU13CASTA1]
MSFQRQIMSRPAASEANDEAVSHPVSPATARTALAKPRAWAEQFYREVESTGLPLATLNRITQECETLPAAMAKVTQALAAGQGHAALRKPAQADEALRITASHAKAHQPRRGAICH